VWNRSSDTNTTVYCGCINKLSEDVVRATFGIYGQITGIHSFPYRSYFFVRFATKEAACNAICCVHGMRINGGIAKCSWGKEKIVITPSTGPSMSSPLYGSSSGNSSIQNVNSLAAASQLGNSN
jgi:hypothetical protein